MNGRSCCMPSRSGSLPPPAAGAGAIGPITATDATIPRGGWIELGGGNFRMGSDAADGYPEDGEGPSREVCLSPFRIAATTVTNAEFSRFVRATQYVTDAERVGLSHVFYLQVDPAVRRSVRQVPRGLPWWLPIEFACWQRPEGPGSSTVDRQDHPVVHISWNDAQAYCDWAGCRLPTEAEWEFAARGGLEHARFPWGDAADLEARCHVWRGSFPASPAPGWHPVPVAVTALPPNGHGLHHATGNVWQWCADWFSPAFHLETAARDPLQQRITGRRSQRGGSFLCHASYCNRYRVAGRHGNTPASTSGNCGFRVAAARAQTA